MAKKQRFEVTCEYPADYYFATDPYKWEDRLDKIARQFGGREWGTGMGGGARDLHYGDFKTEQKATAFASRLKRFKKIRKVKVFESEEWVLAYTR